jgi:hypothetical protein
MNTPVNTLIEPSHTTVAHLTPHITPSVYVYTTPEYAKRSWVGTKEGTGLLKIGYTTRDALTRVREQFPIRLPDVQPFTLLLDEPAIDDKGNFFTDKTIHQRLKAKGFHNINGEWFECTLEDVKVCIAEIKQDQRLSSSRHNTYGMRPEQAHAVKITVDYYKQFPLATQGKPPKFLWNAKMRFGKTFATYQLAKEMGWKRLLVLTYKPAVQSAWEDDLKSHADFEGWQFIGKGEGFDTIDESKPLVWFASFQDVLGKNTDGGIKERLEEMFLTDWDGVAFDEYHFGAWREKAQDIFDEDVPDSKDLEKFNQDALPLKAKHFLYLSGTPFRALTSGEFLEDQIFNWTYADEQRAKEQWDNSKGVNPYLELPRMVLMTYQMPEGIRKKAQEASLNEFGLNEFFKADYETVSSQQQSLFPTSQASGKRAVFKYEADVQKWLDWIRGKDILGKTDNAPIPYDDVRLLGALNHTFWFLPSVASCDAMAELLKKPQNLFYNDYTIVVAAGLKAGIGLKALEPVNTAIGNPIKTKTITLSCGKLTTGVSIPAWGGIFMLRDTSSPETYFQTAFRAQTPWVLRNKDATDPNAREIIKSTCYVFDFAPNRALSLIADYNSRLVQNEGESPEKKIEEF